MFVYAAKMVQAQGWNELKVESDPNAVRIYKKMGMVKIDECSSKPEGRVLDVMVVTLPFYLEGEKPAVVQHLFKG